MARVPSQRLPVIITQRVYARATLYAEADGMTLEEYTEAALIEAGRHTEARMQEAEYAAACQEARATRRPNPTRAEYFGQQQQPFVRRQRSASENQAGPPFVPTPSERHGSAGRVKGGEAGTGATRSHAQRSEHGEDARGPTL